MENVTKLHSNLRVQLLMRQHHQAKGHVIVPSGGDWLCYILHCADNTLYTGITNDLNKRLAAHNAGTATKYTRTRIPVELVFVEICAGKSSALKREMKIKSLSRAEKLSLIESVIG